MGWKDHLQETPTFRVLPWTGSSYVSSKDSRWKIYGNPPPTHGWFKFELMLGRLCSYVEPAEPDHSIISFKQTGYLVGDHFVLEGQRVMNLTDLELVTERVFLVERGLPRFTRVTVGRVSIALPLIFISQAFPLGPEEEVNSAFLDRKSSVNHIKGVPPALEMTFRLENLRRTQIAERRAAILKAQKEAEEKRIQEELKNERMRIAGLAIERRRLATVDFETAAKAALAVGNALYQDHRESTRKGEYVVTFKVEERRFECVCDKDLRIIDSGICLVAHHNDGNFKAGTKGDTWFTLESLPSVIRQAQRERKLVVYRHADGNNDWDDEPDNEEDYD